MTIWQKIVALVVLSLVIGHQIVLHLSVRDLQNIHIHGCTNK